MTLPKRRNGWGFSASHILRISERLTKLALSCIPEKEFEVLRQVTDYNRSRIF